MALTKLSAGTDQYWLLNDIPHQRGQFDVSARIGQGVVEIYSLNTLKSLARGNYDEFSPDGITPYASTQALIDDLKTFFFRSVSGGGGGSVNSVTATSPLSSTGGTDPIIDIIDGTSVNDILKWDGANWVVSNLGSTSTKYTETLLAVNWVLDVGTIYYQDVTHSLNSEDVVISTYNPTTKETVIVEEIDRISTDVIRIKIEGNTDDVRVVVFNSGLSVVQQTEKVVVNNPSTPYTPTIGDVVIWDCTTGNKVVNLPQASLNPSMEVNIKKIDNTSNTLTINTVGVEEIDGTTSPLVLTTQYDSFTLISNSSNWFIL